MAKSFEQLPLFNSCKLAACNIATVNSPFPVTHGTTQSGWSNEVATFQSTSRYPWLYSRRYHVHLLQHAKSFDWLGCYSEQSECFVRGYYHQARLAKDLAAYCRRSFGSEATNKQESLPHPPQTKKNSLY